MSWEQRINRALQEGTFTREDKNLGADWGRCAVGELFGTATNPRKCPEFRDLYECDVSRITSLGYTFVHQVESDLLEEAMLTFKDLREIKDSILQKKGGETSGEASKPK